MDYRIIWSPDALNHLEHLVRFISRDNPEAAAGLGNDIISKVLLLENFPRLGKIFREAGRDTLREISVPPYRVFMKLTMLDNRLK